MNTSSKRFPELSWLVLLALAGSSVTLVSGLASSLTYTSFEPKLRALGLTLQHFRPIHDSFAFGWVFLGGVAAIYFYMWSEHGALSPASRKRMICHLVLWAVAGVGILITLLAGQFTGREYLGYRPVFSVLIIIGWLLFMVNYFKTVGFRLRNRPVYIYMWSVSIPLFVLAFLEGHFYLLEYLSSRPVRDIAIQWKSNGVLVGSFNLLAYGALMYVVSRIRGNDLYAHSRTAFGLFYVGILNTFTNYGHHTFHLPQTPWIHWIAFLVSMLEIIILAKIFFDLMRMPKVSEVKPALATPVRFIRSATLWTFLLLGLAIAISVPPLNSLIHGTHMVVAHAMGSMIGIDSMILWAAIAYMLLFLGGKGHESTATRRVCAAVPWINGFLFLFLALFLLRGVAAGWSRHAGPSAPDFSKFVELFPTLMVFSGTGLAVSLFWVYGHWGVSLWKSLRAPKQSQPSD